MEVYSVDRADSDIILLTARQSEKVLHNRILINCCISIERRKVVERGRGGGQEGVIARTQRHFARDLATWAGEKI